MRPPVDRIFVISLTRAAERRAEMTRRLDALGLPFEFFDAVDGSKLAPEQVAAAYDGRRRRLFFGRDLTPGEIGCLLSHRAVFQKISDENIPAALVLEDDTRLLSDLPGVLRALRETPVPWDIVRFLSREKVYNNSRAVAPLCGGYALTRPFGTPGGAYGTVLNARAARALLHRMRRNWMPNDVTLGHVWKDGIDVYALRPSPVVADMEIESTIGRERFDKTLHVSGPLRLAYPLARAGLKLYEMTGKYGYRLSCWLRDRKKTLT